MMQLDYTFERQIELERRASYTQGENSGLEKGRRAEVFLSVQDGDYALERGAQKLNLSAEEFCRQMEKSGYRVPVPSRS